MEVIKLPDFGGAACDRCDARNYYGTTPNGSSAITCPHCKNYIEDDEISEENDWEYCERCGFIFQYSNCSHAENGCTDNVYNTLKISEFKMENKLYHGTPKFKTREEYNLYIKKITDIKCICNCKGIQYDCSEAAYKNYRNEKCGFNC